MLQEGDAVLVRDTEADDWKCGFVTRIAPLKVWVHGREKESEFKIVKPDPARGKNPYLVAGFEQLRGSLPEAFRSHREGVKMAIDDYTEIPRDLHKRLMTAGSLARQRGQHVLHAGEGSPGEPGSASAPSSGRGVLVAAGSVVGISRPASGSHALPGRRFSH